MAMKNISISIDVPDVDAATEFYTKGLGFGEPRKGPHGSVLLDATGLRVCLLNKPKGSVAVPGSAITRTYRRHWTPIHLDIMVDDLGTALRKAIAAGACQEGETYTDEQYSIAFCSDPYGNGFCLGEEHN